MVATAFAFEVVIEDARLPVAKGDFYVGASPKNEGVSFLDHNTKPPLGVSLVEDPISNLKV